jgi:hypothetical protein
MKNLGVQELQEFRMERLDHGNIHLPHYPSTPVLLGGVPSSGLEARELLNSCNSLNSFSHHVDR